MESFQMQHSQNSLVAIDPAAVAAAETAKAKIQAAYIMALQKPRKEDMARTMILKACRRIDFAEDVMFKKPVGRKKIEGLSIRFAEVALKEWGNVLTETQTLYEDDRLRRIRVAVTDLETNTCFSKELQINKTIERRSAEGRKVLSQRLNTEGKNVYIVVATEDELMTKENAVISKVVRNEGLRLIPSDIKEEAKMVAKETVRKNVTDDPDRAKKSLIDAFASLNILPVELEDYLGHPIANVSPKELTNLRSIYKAISDEDASWSDYTGQSQDSKTTQSGAEFDSEFSEYANDERFSEFVTAAWQANMQGRNEKEFTLDKFKVAVMHDGAGKFRAAFNEHVMQISEDEKTKSAGSGKGKAVGKKSKKEPTKKEKLQSELDGWKHLEVKIYEEESEGKEPKTIKDMESLLDRIQARVDAAKDEGMPGA